MIEVSERCPECGGDNIQIIDYGRDLDTNLRYARVVCFDCNADWHCEEEGEEEEEE